MQKASLGRIVIYRLPEDAAAINGGRDFPAMIVRAPGPVDPAQIGTDCAPDAVEACVHVNLRVFTDDAWTLRVTDVPLYEADNANCGTPGTCFWPPRS